MTKKIAISILFFYRANENIQSGEIQNLHTYYFDFSISRFLKDKRPGFLKKCSVIIYPAHLDFRKIKERDFQKLCCNYSPHGNIIN